MSSFVTPPVANQQFKTPAPPSQTSPDSISIPTLRAPTDRSTGRGLITPASSYRPSTVEPSANYRQFYIKPFEPSTTVEDITQYVCSKTGWDQASFRCQALTSAANRGCPLSFVSFKISVLDNPVYVNTITKKDFWPSFVSVDPFIPRRRK